MLDYMTDKLNGTPGAGYRRPCHTSGLRSEKQEPSYSDHNAQIAVRNYNTSMWNGSFMFSSIVKRYSVKEE